jgi:antitoxin MazE
MNVKISKWGNSLAVRIPHGIAQSLDLHDKSDVFVSMEEGALVLRPVEKRKRYDLDELLAGISEENLHGETKTGDSVGNEF